MRTSLANYHEQWCAILGQVEDSSLLAPRAHQWPYADRPFGDVLAWLNLELMKNASEIGYARFLFAVKARNPAAPAFPEVG